MARQSFTLRRLELGGSGLQQVHPDNASAGNADIALRSDDYVYAVQPLGPTLAGEVGLEGGADSWLEASAIDYGTVLLTWRIRAELDVAVRGQSLTELRIVFSDEGTPRSVSDGETIVRWTKAHWVDQHVHVITEQPYTQQPWAYYSLFGRYTDGATVWYERLSSLSELVPSDHGSTAQLWRRIPLHYRMLDDQVAVDLDMVEGPLHQFLGLFGFEADRQRTMVQSLWRINDPDYTHEQALSALARQVGLPVDLNDVPAKLVRNLLANYGFLRERKGTLIGAMAYLNALTGCPITVLRHNASNRYRFMIGAQRVNLITSPRFAAGPGFGSGWAASDTTGSTANLVWDPATKLLRNTAGSTRTIRIHPSTGALLARDVPYYTAVYASRQNGGALDPATHSPTFSASTTNPTTAGVTAVPDLIWEPAAAYTADSRMLRATLYLESVGAPVTVFPILQVTLAANEAVLIDYWKLEPFNDGSYFDGNSELGGFINDNTGMIAKDYRWTGSAGQSTSVYTEYLSHKRAAVLKTLDFFMPALFTLDGATRGFEFEFSVLPGRPEQLVNAGTYSVVAGRWPAPPLRLLAAPTIDAFPAVGVPVTVTDPVWSDTGDSEQEEEIEYEYRWVQED